MPLAKSNEARISQPTDDLVQHVDHENNAPSNSSQPSCSTNDTSSVQPFIEIDRARTPLASLPIQSIESPHIPLENLAPLPRAEYLSRSNRKRAKSDILSGSPYKLALEESLVSKKVPKNVPKIQSKTVPKTNSKPLPKKGKQPFKVPKKMPKKKVWRCPACTEVYVDPPQKTG
ncbi:unnamed protein product [Diatraea saccharalis]|uniref:Uncharacterized protein n=1 Tax=Diatraea saccharalis TaxID=40085 RepID=A0A9N9WE60_9NEOP|nr:unnamed protein product [Diatraea saccharalis]